MASQAWKMNLTNEQKRSIRQVRFKNFLVAIPTHTILMVFCASAILVMIWALIMSVRPSFELFQYGAWALPKTWAWSNYVEAWNAMRVGRYFFNTVLYSVVNTVGAVLTAACTAYVMARVKFWGRDFLYYVVILSMMIPGFLSMVPRYFMLKDWGLIDTYFVIFLLGWSGGLSFNMILLLNFFETLPVELEEAAFIDGASSWQIFWQVMFPLARPGLVTIGIFSFMGHWNDFLTPLIYLRDQDKYPLGLGLQLLSRTVTYSAKHTQLFAGVIMFTIPIIIIYLILKDRIVEGLTIGAIKG